MSSIDVKIAEEALYASGLRIFRCQAAAEAQRGQPDLECYRKAGGSLCVANC